MNGFPLRAGAALALLLAPGCIRHNPEAGHYREGVSGGGWRFPAPSGDQEESRDFIKITLEEGEVETRGKVEESFRTELSSQSGNFAGPEEVAAFSEAVEPDYRVGPGDRFAFQVRGRPDISRDEIVVAPDGLVSLPRVGVFRIAGMTVPEATDYLRETLSKFYETPDVSLELRVINNNKVFVLGRVAKPGAVHFDGPGTLLEALSLAGGLPADTRLSFLSRCMIVRGKDMLIWVDLRELLEQGNLRLNTRLRNGDFIFIPQSEDQVAYVMGEVPRPGVMVLRSEMTLLDAVMRAGGPTLNADDTRVYLIRSVDGQGVVRRIDFRDMYQRGDVRKNYVLRDGDMVYVGRSRLGGFNAFLTQMMPGMNAIDFSLNTAESFGAMAELRQRIWGQEGFINRTE